MTIGRLNGKVMRAVVLAAVVMVGVSGVAGARITRHSAVPTYSDKTGRVPSSERVHTTLHVSNDTTVFPAPKNAVARTSQRAALFAIGDFSPLHIAGRTFYPSVLFGLVTNSVMQYACNIPGLTIPTPPTTTPTTACPKGLFYQRDPMWVVIQHGACIPSSGGPPIPPGVTTTTTQPTTTTTFDVARCVLYTFVSATTGKYLYAEN
jgi:hypothetical protein